MDDEPNQIELDARKELKARGLMAEAIRLWIEIGYSEEEITEFVSEVYEEEAS